MRPVAPPALGSAAAAALLLTVACDPGRSLSVSEPSESPTLPTVTLSSYFPPPAAAGGWRKTTDATRVQELGMDAGKLDALGAYLMSLPYEGYYTGVSGYKASNKAALVVKNGWIVGEYYNQAGANTAVYYLASNGKTFAMLLAGHMAMNYPELGFGLSSRLYDRRWLPQGYPLTDARKADITFDHVFRHASGIIPEAQAAIASGAVATQTGWNFAPFTVGKDPDYPVSAPLYFTPGNPSTYTKGSTYSSVAFNHFGLIFRNVTGLEASAYLRQAILNPVGVGRMDYKLTSGMGDYVWAPAGNGLASARDFARLGYLMLHEGDWNGTPLFPASWLRQFTASSAYRNIRSNVDCRWGSKYPSDMYRTTGSGQNWVLVVPSLDLVVTFNGRTPSALAAEIESVSLTRLFAAVTDRYVACDGTVFNDTPPTGNTPPAASFGSTCSGLSCDFTDTSTDSDGSIAAWNWTFGDGSTSTARNPSHTFATVGTYTVALTVTDDDHATGTTTRSFTVHAITLSASGRKRKGYAYVDLGWSGATGPTVDLYRNNARLAMVPNSGNYTDATGRKGAATFSYRVCEAGTSTCSNTVTVRF
jgi:CubicO group peptidase (beta-lactamase class C family)